MSKIKYIVYDCESVVDGRLVAEVKYPDQKITPDEAVAFYKAELLEEKGHDFVPISFHVPVSICVANVDEDYRVSRFYRLTGAGAFWAGVNACSGATLVDFNGRGFDLPLLTVAAMREGISCPGYFDDTRYGHRYRYTEKHVDLMDWLTEYGAWRVVGGLDLLGKLVGAGGKGGTSGGDVEKMVRDGDLEAVDHYCLDDVLQTYLVFLRTRVLMGKITLEQEEELAEDARGKLEEAKT